MEKNVSKNISIIKADLTQHDYVYLVPLSDFHIGAAEAHIEIIKGYIDWIAEHDNAYTILNGDLFNAATKTSTPELYEEVMTVDESLVVLEDLLKPIADRIIAACSGGHEMHSLYRTVGADYTWHLMRNLGIEKAYTPDGGVVLIKTKPLNAKDKTFFSVIFTHGYGSARTRGAKVNKLERFGNILAMADIVLMSHDHTQWVGRDNQITVPSWESEDTGVHRRLLVATGAFLGYPGYPFRSGYPPADLGTPRIRLDKKIEDGIIRKDIHASI